MIDKDLKLKMNLIQKLRNNKIYTDKEILNITYNQGKQLKLTENEDKLLFEMCVYIGENKKIDIDFSTKPRKEEISMSEEIEMEKLNKKLEQEMKEFRDKLKENGVDYAIDKAYDLVVKQEIIDTFADRDLDKNEIKALLKNKNVLDEIYYNWLDFDGNLREQLEYCVDDSISKITNSYIEKIKKNKAKER